MDRNTPRRGQVYALFADIMGFARTLEGLSDPEHDDLELLDLIRESQQKA